MTERAACARKPIAGLAWNSFCQPAAIVQISSQDAGRMLTQATRWCFILNSTTVQSSSAIAASIWLEMPNRGQSVLMPPSGSMTP